MRAIHARAVFVLAGSLLWAGVAVASDGQNGLSAKLTGTVLFVMLLSILPVGMFTLYAAFRLVMGQEEDGLGGKAFVGAFFHRLMFTVAFWVLVISGAHKSVPIGEYPLILLTNLGVAFIAIRFCMPDTFARLLVVSVIFCVLDSLALGAVMLSSVALLA
jgi:hypothetical protein